MNLLDSAVSKSGSSVTLTFAGNTIVLPAEKGKALEEAGYIGKEVIMGIRPEDLHDEEEAVKADRRLGQLRLLSVYMKCSEPKYSCILMWRRTAARPE